VNPPAKLTSAFEPVCPGPAGAKEWMHMVFSLQTGMVCLPVIENCAVFRSGQAFYRAGLPFWGSAADAAAMGPGESHGSLRALKGHCVESGFGLVSEDGRVALLDPTATPLVLDAVRASSRAAGIRLRVLREPDGEAMSTTRVEEVTR